MSAIDQERNSGEGSVRPLKGSARLSPSALCARPEAPEEPRESFVDRQVREAAERGDFDRLPGRGKPLPPAGRRDELWWVRKKMKEEDLSYLPPTLQVRRERELTLEQIAAARTEDEVLRILGAINERIRTINRFPQEGPPSSVMPIDEAAALEGWRQAHEQG